MSVEEYMIDDDGKWLLRKGKKYLLVEPTQTYRDKQILKGKTKKEVLKVRLQELNKKLSDEVEELLDLQVTKGLITEEELPVKLKLARNEKKNIRNVMKGL